MQKSVSGSGFGSELHPRMQTFARRIGGIYVEGDGRVLRQ